MDDARAWIEIHRENAPGQDTARGALQIMRQFADSEEIRAAAIAAVIGPGTSQDPLPEDLLTDFHAAMADFSDRWPESSQLSSVTVPDDPTEVLDAMAERVRTTPEQERAIRELTSKIVVGELPLGVLAAAVEKSYAEVTIKRGVDILPARHPDPAEHVTSTNAAIEAIDGSVVIDTTALLVTRLLNPELRANAHGAFRLLTVDDALTDARVAHRMLSANTVGHLVWDSEAEAPRLIEADPHETAEHAAAAQKLVADIEQIQRLPRPPVQDDRVRGAFFSPWFSVIDLARSRGVALWSDDAALRILARSETVPAFSTLAVLQLLTERGLLSSGERQEVDRSLVRGRVGDMPLLSNPRDASLCSPKTNSGGPEASPSR